MKTKKKQLNFNKNKITSCNKFLNKNKEVIIFNHIEDLYNKINNKCKNINFKNNVNLSKIREQTLDKLKTKKGNIQFLLNSIFSNLQYYNVSGFNLTKLIKNVYHEIKSTTLDKKKWHKANLNLLEIINNYSIDNLSLPTFSIILMSEEYDLNMMNSNNNSNQNEFKTIYNNKYIDTSKNFIKNEEQIYHTYYDIKIKSDNCRIVNIHSGSGLNQDNLINKIKDFLIRFPKKKNQYLILGGDSNIYYNRGETKDENKLSNGGIKNINKLIEKLFSINYITLISKYIIFKTRPFNFFNNAQTAFKNGDELVETMILCIPLDLYLKYKNNNEFFFDKKNYFISIDEKNNMKKVKIEDFYEYKLNAFQGTEYITKTGKLNVSYNDIFNYNNGGTLISDHIPIYLDLGDTRILYANNASLIGSRGINNNMNNKKLWKSDLLLLNKDQSANKVNKNIKYLDKLSISLLKIILKNNLSLINKLNIKYDRIKYNKLNDKEKLRYLTNLQICIV